MGKYSLPVNEDTLDLIEVLNGGVRPKVEDEPTCFVFDTDALSRIHNKIEREDDLYENGYTKDTDIHWLIG